MTVKERNRRPTGGYVAGASEDPRKYDMGERVPVDIPEGMLITLRYELYEGSWDKMRADLEKRKAGRPYIYKQVNQIEADEERIDGLEEIEKSSGGFIVEGVGEDGEIIHFMRETNEVMLEKYSLL